MTHSVRDALQTAASLTGSALDQTECPSTVKHRATQRVCWDAGALLVKTQKVLQTWSQRSSRALMSQ